MFEIQLLYSVSCYSFGWNDGVPFYFDDGPNPFFLQIFEIPVTIVGSITLMKDLRLILYYYSARFLSNSLILYYHAPLLICCNFQCKNLLFGLDIHCYTYVSLDSLSCFLHSTYLDATTVSSICNLDSCTVNCYMITTSLSSIYCYWYRCPVCLIFHRSANNLVVVVYLRVYSFL